MYTSSARGSPGLGILAAHLLFAVQDELYRELARAGYDDLRPRHGIVLAYLDASGSRATDIAARSGRRKQIVGRMVDELEAMAYVYREPDPADRRAKRIVPTRRGRAVMKLSDRIMTGIERQCARAVGETAYDDLVRDLQQVVEDLRGKARAPASQEA